MRKTLDARKLGAAAQQLLRRQVVQAVRGEMTQTVAACTMEFRPNEGPRRRADASLMSRGG